MARYRISLPAQEDLRQILAVRTQRWGGQGRRRYAAHLTAAMRRVAVQPAGPNTRSRGELLSGLRSFHIRHVRGGDLSSKVGEPVHVIYFRAAQDGTVEIVRVLHERMEPARHIKTSSIDEE